ncbi:MAG: hypothetical protein JWP97_3345 [Labilithrix sp.]|nr:hypothetical protein [Labilithrix sp.]
MAERYVRPTVAGWLTPTLVAPWVSAYGAVIAVALLHIDGLFFRGLGIAAGLLIASIWAFVYCAILIVTDLALLGVKVRTLPAGGRGWVAGLLSPLAVFASYVAFPPYKFYAAGPWAIGAAVIAPMVLVALVSRVASGVKPPR